MVNVLKHVLNVEYAIANVIICLVLNVTKPGSIKSIPDEPHDDVK